MQRDQLGNGVVPTLKLWSVCPLADGNGSWVAVVRPAGERDTRQPEAVSSGFESDGDAWWQ